MRIGMLILCVILVLPLATASTISGKVSLEVINPTYEQTIDDYKSLEARYIEQELAKESEERTNLITGQVVSSEVTGENSTTYILWFLGLLAGILLLYFLRLLIKLRQ